MQSLGKLASTKMLLFGGINKQKINNHSYCDCKMEISWTTITLISLLEMMKEKTKTKFVTTIMTCKTKNFQHVILGEYGNYQTHAAYIPLK